eukprot:15117901-Ditylum_brightwellii.AAC.1
MQEEQNDNIIDESETDQEDAHLIADTDKGRKKVRITVSGEATARPNPENEEEWEDLYGSGRREGLPNPENEEEWEDLYGSRRREGL